MNRSTLYTAAFSTLLAVASFNTSAAEPQDKAHCSLKTLKGSYAYSIQGYRGGEPYASSGLFTFNGAGGVGVLYTSSIERTQLFVTGSYMVNGDCSGTMTLADKTVVNNFYLSPSGDSFNFTRVSSNDVIGTEARRVSRELLVKQP
ncbi:MAG TPA: hypothetical protein VGE50_05565 [Gammaproteobacteria bacterium]